jgi:histidyl-tRNA synthetase
MSTISNLPPSGTRDFSTSDLLLRSEVFSKLEALSKQRGFCRIDTPAIENIDTLSGKYGEEGEQLIFKILKRGEGESTGLADMALRYDLTVPTMRYYSRYKEKLPKIFKRYQFGPVWRADRPGKDRYREFFQFDFDIIGSASIMSDIECIKILADSLISLNLSEFTIQLNSRGVLESLLRSYDLNQEIWPDIIKSMDKIDKIGISGFKLELEKINIESALRSLLISDFSDDDFESVVRERVLSQPEGKKLLREIDLIISIVQKNNSSFKIKFNPYLARGLDYYTGPIYEVTIDGVKGSIAAGGRYDKLSGLFLKKIVPVCGSSLGIERILSLVTADKISDSAPRVYVGIWSDDDFETVNDLVNLLRNNNIITEINLLKGKIGEQIGYAAKMEFTYFIFQGPDEIKNNSVVIKNLKTEKQDSILITELCNYLT